MEISSVYYKLCKRIAYNLPNIYSISVINRYKRTTLGEVQATSITFCIRIIY